MRQTTERLLRYVRQPSQSDPTAPKTLMPTTQSQLDMASMVATDLTIIAEKYDQDLNWRIQENGILIAEIPATPGFEDAPVGAYSAHVDTYANGKPEVEPIIHPRYDGVSNIKLPRNDVVIPAAELVGLKGQDVITASGDSVLGADCKAGLAAIVQAVEELFKTNTPHAKFYLVFFPDEELGRFNPKEDLDEDFVKELQFFITVDGELLGEVDTATYSGRNVEITFHGRDAHPGSQGKKLVPATHMVADFIVLLRTMYGSPWQKEEDGSYQFGMNFMAGTPAKAGVECIPRSFTDVQSLKLVEMLREVANQVVEMYTRDDFTPHFDFEVIHQYSSTADAILANPWLTEIIKQAMSNVGETYIVKRAEGGTDGSMLNRDYPNIPSPNVGVGGRNFHMFTECIGAEDLEDGTQLVFQMMKLTGEARL